MAEPWGLSGPQFLLLYGTALVAVGVAWLLWPSVALALRGGTQADLASPLDVYRFAYLAGGPNRVVDTAIAALLEQNRLRASSGGRLSRIASGLLATPIEAAIYEAVGQSSRTVAQVRASKAVLPPTQELGRDLERRGLVVVVSGRYRVGIALAFLALFAVGAIRSVNGAHLHRPTSNLNVFLVVTAILAVLAFSTRDRTKARPTKAGRALVDSTRADRQTAGVLGTALVAGAASLVAVGGFAQYPDGVTSAALMSGGGSSGGGSSCGGGGGGGCGGGGCGG
ncbi:TIGR04222 domain-containing membrane protein [Amycolatopsis benzoatilytica]|uniref:TIGR04222 domain-containing membrane protein n=1 Tax=Amycolatopsis benzoatilytica TaxID=346045 RepID=UPI000369EB33|nr:TIGR04222 domain-containing membrane protein [Amycolatopsis benzoatilytica]